MQLTMYNIITFMNYLCFTIYKIYFCLMICVFEVTKRTYGKIIKTFN